jgi:hypothetical protein
MLHRLARLVQPQQEKMTLIYLARSRTLPVATDAHDEVNACDRRRSSRNENTGAEYRIDINEGQYIC